MSINQTTITFSAFNASKTVLEVTFLYLLRVIFTCLLPIVSQFKIWRNEKQKQKVMSEL